MDKKPDNTGDVVQCNPAIASGSTDETRPSSLVHQTLKRKLSEYSQEEADADVFPDSNVNVCVFFKFKPLTKILFHLLFSMILLKAMRKAVIHHQSKLSSSLHHQSQENCQLVRRNQRWI